MLAPMGLSAKDVKRCARDAGFDLCGVAAAVAGEEDAHLQEWLARGYHGDMKYMERRRPIGELLPDCRSVIVMGTNYHVPHTPKPDAAARVSRYAWGEDYHRVVGRMLVAFEQALRARAPGEEFRAYCDTGPLLEKAWAERAGIGWLGKNGCLISQEYGSWIFLSEMLTTAALDADTPHPDRCGTCERCLHSCPTDAFVAPRVIDARRCIPYLTIEQWKPIPKETSVAPWAFGCDVCQEVCPWNQKAKDSARQEFAPRAGHDTPDLKSWVTMTGPEYRAKFHDTALSRPGRRGLARNALAILRESGLDEETKEHARNDGSKLVRDQLDA